MACPDARTSNSHTPGVHTTTHALASCVARACTDAPVRCSLELQLPFLLLPPRQPRHHQRSLTQDSMPKTSSTIALRSLNQLALDLDSPTVLVLILRGIPFHTFVSSFSFLFASIYSTIRRPLDVAMDGNLTACPHWPTLLHPLPTLQP